MLKDSTNSPVVTKSAHELRIGLTKLSGSKPNLKVRKADDVAKMPIIKNPIMFVVNKTRTSKPYDVKDIPFGANNVPRIL